MVSLSRLLIIVREGSFYLLNCQNRHDESAIITFLGFVAINGTRDDLYLFSVLNVNITRVFRLRKIVSGYVFRDSAWYFVVLFIKYEYSLIYDFNLYESKKLILIIKQDLSVG